GAQGADVTTTYSYDAGNRLAKVETTAEGVTQVRQFNYDNRAFLTSEMHPEKGRVDHGFVKYFGYDAPRRI
ncbi:MAG: hypothetical protein GY856_08645, partial [bacterium]|nr:hypothetical protein [bacterium]